MPLEDNVFDGLYGLGMGVFGGSFILGRIYSKNDYNGLIDKITDTIGKTAVFNSTLGAILYAGHLAKFFDMTETGNILHYSAHIAGSAIGYWFASPSLDKPPGNKYEPKVKKADSSNPLEVSTPADTMTIDEFRDHINELIGSLG